MDNFLLYAPLSLYLIYILYKLFAVWKNKESNSSEKFSRGTGGYVHNVLFLTILATMIGPGYSYGAINKFYEFGFFYTIFFLFSIVQFWIFGQYFAEKIKKIGDGMETAGDLLGKPYGKSAQIITGVLTVFFSIALVAVLGVGGGKVLSSISSISLNMGIFYTVLFITLYSFYGGIATVIKTDKVQLVLICIFAVIGISAGINQFLKQDDFSITYEILWNTGGMSSTIFISTAIAFFLGEAFLPVYAIRGLISRDGLAAKKSFKRAAYFGFVWFFLLTFIGISGHLVEISSDLVYVDLVKETFGGRFGIILLGFAITGMLSVVMSTLDSILNAAGVSLRKDIISQLFSINENQKLSYTRLSILIISLLGLFVTLFSTDIVGILIMAYTIWVPAIVIPLAYYLIKGSVINKKSGTLAILAGVLGWLLFEFYFVTLVPAILVGIFINALILILIEFSSRKND